MRMLRRKLRRELRLHWVQIASIALVMACGIMTIMGLRGTLVSIRNARDAYYEQYRFADVFGRLQRAPMAVARRVADIPGVAATETRIVRDVKLDVPGLAEPAVGHVVSIPEDRRPMLNDLHVRTGRWIAPGRQDEALISERFAQLNHLGPGDSVSAVINGRFQRLRLVGIAMSPEFVVEFAHSGMFVDNRRYGILWTSVGTLENAFDMRGTFNDIAVRLAPRADARGVIASLDALLEPWGGAGAHDRSEQPAARALEDEFRQLAVNATVFPMFFLVVATFLLNVVLSRLVSSQRDEIAALKAFGYTDREVGLHYLGFGVAAVSLGTLLGVPSGMWMGARFTMLYAEYFRFPTLPSTIDWGAALLAVGVCGGFGLLGALGGVRRVMRLPPAEALRPESPARFRPLLLERLGLGRLLTPSARMILRNLERRPIRTGIAVFGVSLAVALLASGRFPYDAFDRMLDVEFHRAQRYDALATFGSVRSGRAAKELANVPGVIDAAPFRAAAVRITRDGVSRTTALTGLEPASDFYRLVGTDGERHSLRPASVVVTVGLARALRIAPGDSIDVEFLERGETRRLLVSGRYDPMIGQGLYAPRAWVNALLREEDVADGAYLAVAPGRDTAVFARMKALSGVAAVTSRAATIANIEDQMRESMVFVLALITFSGCLIAVGVVYNNARVALSERGRELASLRVLGFTVNEVWSMQLGEQAAIVISAIPVGIGIGALFSLALVTGFETERFHFPFVMALRSQLFAAAVVLASAALAGLVIRRRIRRMDMVTALRSRE